MIERNMYFYMPDLLLSASTHYDGPISHGVARVSGEQDC